MTHSLEVIRLTNNRNKLGDTLCQFGSMGCCGPICRHSAAVYKTAAHRRISADAFKLEGGWMGLETADWGGS